MQQLDVDALRQFRATWEDGPQSAQKNLERLRSFLNFCQQAGWIEKNPAKALKPPKLPEKSSKVKVFSADEIKSILEACDKYPQQNSYGHDNRARVKALVLTLRYSGMRIGDCVGLQKSHLKGDKLFLNTQKSGEQDLRPAAEGRRGGAAEDRERQRVFLLDRQRAAEVGCRRLAARAPAAVRARRRHRQPAHVPAHVRTDLLSRGIPIEDVSVLLGHRSVRITDAYYSHWVKARRDRLEERVRELWT